MVPPSACSSSSPLTWVVVGSPLGRTLPSPQLDKSLLGTSFGVPQALPFSQVLLPLLLPSASNTYSPRPGTAPVLLFLQMSMTAPRIDSAHSSAAEFATKATPPPVAPCISELWAAAPSPPCYFTTEMNSITPPLESPGDLNTLSAC